MKAIWNPADEGEKGRLTVQAEMLDPVSIACLERLGVAESWQCAEIGAGTGTIASWLARRVGPKGRVLATDLDTRFLEPLAAQGIDVRRHDVLADALEDSAYDLVHARLLLALLPDPVAGLKRMTRALRPGGWILIEDYDQRTATIFDPPSELQSRVSMAVNRLFEQSGADPYAGAKLVARLKGAGLTRIGAQAHLEVVLLGSRPAEALALKLEQLREKLVAARLLGDEEVDLAIDYVRDPGNGAHYPPLMVSGWGQRPL